MRRAFLNQELWGEWSEGDSVTLPDETAHYFSRVLRLPSGTLVELFDGNGRALTGSIDIERAVTIKVDGVRKYESLLPKMWLAQAKVPMQKLEIITRQCTEMGVRAIAIFDGQRSKPESKQGHMKRMNRLQKIAIDAARQSGQYYVPTFSQAVDFNEIIQMCQGFGGLSTFGEPSASETLTQQLRGDQALAQQGVLFVNGPEGGFTSAEEQRLRDAGGRGVRLGQYVMRTETAPMVAFAVAQAALGWM